MVYNLFLIKSPLHFQINLYQAAVLLTIRLNKIYNQLRNCKKTIIRNFKKPTVYFGFKGNIWGADLADMQSMSKYNKEMKYLLCAIDLFSKYAWVVSIKDKKVSVQLTHFKILKEFNRKPNKILVDKGSEFCYKSFKK